MIVLQFLDAAHISTLNCDEMAGDRRRQSAVQVPTLYSSRRPAQAGVKDGYPAKKWLAYFTAMLV